jgi:inner membrane protein
MQLIFSQMKELTYMDPVTHGLLGLTQGVVLSKEKVKPLAKDNVVLWASLLGNLAPDLDFVIRIASGELMYLKYHRVFTHSIPGAMLLSLVITLILGRIFPKEKKSKIFIVSFLGTSLHVFFDILTSYGTQALWPIIPTRMSWDLLMIVDPLIIGVILLGLILVLFKQWNAKKIFNLITVFLVLYIGGRFYIHQSLQALVTHKYLGESIEQSSVLPPIYGISKWKYVVETPNCYKVGDVDFLSQQVLSEEVLQKGFEDRILAASANNPTMLVFKNFARYPYHRYERVNNHYVVRWFDLRYNYANRYPYTVEVTLNNKLKFISSKLLNNWQEEER